MSYWLFFVHSHNFYHMFFRGLRFADFNGQHNHDRYYNIMPKALPKKASDEHADNSVSENADKRQAYRNSSVIAGASFENGDRRQVYINSSVIPRTPSVLQDHGNDSDKSADTSPQHEKNRKPSACATVEEMGLAFSGREEEPSLRVRKMIQDHFAQHGMVHCQSLGIFIQAFSFALSVFMFISLLIKDAESTAFYTA